MINLRKATVEDCRLIWKWRNDPVVRTMSFVSDSIAYNDHIKWYESKIKSPDCYFFIAENSDKKPIGQIRFELEGKEAVVSIILDRKFRNKGFGSIIIAFAAEKLFQISDVNVIHANVKKGNTLSALAFKKSGFIFLEETLIKGQQAVHFILKRMSG